jgi:hypothetical protein
LFAFCEWSDALAALVHFIHRLILCLGVSGESGSSPGVRFSEARRQHREEKDWGHLFSDVSLAESGATETCVEKLAHLFPNASAVRIPVKVVSLATAMRPLQEETVIEFGTAHELLFASGLPLEFEDGVRVVNADGSFDTRAVVVAVRYHEGQKAVAVRFTGEVSNWIIKP